MSIQSITTQAPAVAVTSTGTAPLPARSKAPAETASSNSLATGNPAEQRQQLEAAVKAVQEFTRPMSGNLEFSMDDQTGKTIIKVVDTATNELIRQIPSEEMLEIARALDRLQGILVRQKA